MNSAPFFFPTCQVRVVRFYVSWPSPPPDLSYKRWMKAILAGPRPQRSSEDRMPERMSEDVPDTHAR